MGVCQSSKKNNKKKNNNNNNNNNAQQNIQNTNIIVKEFPPQISHDFNNTSSNEDNQIPDNNSNIIIPKINPSNNANNVIKRSPIEEINNNNIININFNNEQNSITNITINDERTSRDRNRSIISEDNNISLHQPRSSRKINNTFSSQANDNRTGHINEFASFGNSNNEINENENNNEINENENNNDNDNINIENANNNFNDNSQMSNNSNPLNQLINLMNILNSRLMNRNLILLNEYEDPKEYIDWEYDKINKVWKNNGKVNLTDEELERIRKLSIKEITNENYYKKRIWFIKYINDNIYEKNNDNSPLVISRDNILQESYNQFMTTDGLNLKCDMHIFFIDEVAYDIGGVYREWYSCLFREIFKKEYNYFIENSYNGEGKGTLIIPFNNPKIYVEEYLSYYEFFGKLIGKALFDKIAIGNNFNRIILKHLMNLSLEEFDLEDIKYYDIEIYESLNSILVTNMDNNNDLFFVWEIEGNEVELCQNGKNTLIKNYNKNFFVKKVIEFICYENIKDKIDKIKAGFNFIMSTKETVNNKKDASILRIFSIEEFDFLLCGQRIIDILDWKKNTVYKGYYSENYPTIKIFWEVLNDLKHEELLIFYKFCTGCSRVPIDGFSSLQGTRNKLWKFCIESPPSREENDPNRLIEAKTCFNKIVLPEYKTKERMQKAIYTIIQNNTEFFGLK